MDHFLGALCPGFKGYMEQAHERLAISSPTVLAQHCIQSPQNQFSPKKHPQDVEVTLLAARVETGVEVSLPSSAGSHQTTLWIIGGRRLQVPESLTKVLLTRQPPYSPPPPAPSLGAGSLPLIPVPGFSLQLWASLHTHKKSV